MILILNNLANEYANVHPKHTQIHSHRIALVFFSGFMADTENE